jgi:hypothetical protein
LFRYSHCLILCTKSSSSLDRQAVYRRFPPTHRSVAAVAAAAAVSCCSLCSFLIPHLRVVTLHAGLTHCLLSCVSKSGCFQAFPQSPRPCPTTSSAPKTHVVDVEYRWVSTFYFGSTFQLLRRRLGWVYSTRGSVTGLSIAIEWGVKCVCASRHGHVSKSVAAFAQSSHSLTSIRVHNITVQSRLSQM